MLISGSALIVSSLLNCNNCTGGKRPFNQLMELNLTALEMCTAVSYYYPHPYGTCYFLVRIEDIWGQGKRTDIGI